MPSPLAEAIFWIAVACCAVAQAAILRSVIVSAAQPDHGAPATAAHRVVEIGWAILPGVALVFLFLYTWAAIHAPTPPAIIAP